MSSSPHDRAAIEGLLHRAVLGRVVAALDGDGQEVRVVGGAVRDALLGRPLREVDLASTALPDENRRRAERAGFRVVPTGIEHGTLTVLAEGEAFEVTTLREDVETFGRRARVRFGRSFEADAARRDFTINALAVSPDGRLHDTVGGLADLNVGRVRFIGDPATRIREDALRILRFFRFHADFAAGDFDPPSLAAVISERARLGILSRERVRAELLKLLVARRVAETLPDIAGAGLLGLILGGVADFGRFGRASRADAAQPDAVLRLAALGVLVEEDAERLAVRLRLSGAEVARLRAYAGAVAKLRSLASADERMARRLAADLGAGPLRDALAALDGEPRPHVAAGARRLALRYASGEDAVPALPLRGADLVAHGVPAGPEVGRLLALARAAWLAAGCPEGDEVRRRLLAEALAERAPSGA